MPTHAPKARCKAQSGAFFFFYFMCVCVYMCVCVCVCVFFFSEPLLCDMWFRAISLLFLMGLRPARSTTPGRSFKADTAKFLKP